MIKQLRKRLWKDRDLGELARDVSDALGSLTAFEVKQFDAPYTEPMYVGYDHEPNAIVLGRVRNVKTPETPVTAGSLVHFTWEGTRKRCRINEIHDMTPAPGETYRFTFLMVG